jgi:8-oxo-dGTP diphosphatase
MIPYVTGFLFDSTIQSVLLICKKRPAWQAGYLNGVGGKIESGETTTQAMRREFREETGVLINNWTYFVTLSSGAGDRSVDFYWAIKDIQKVNIRTMTDELVGWVTVRDLLHSRQKIIPNLFWLIPMAINQIQGRDSATRFSIVGH